MSETDATGSRPMMDRIDPAGPCRCASRADHRHRLHRLALGLALAAWQPALGAEPTPATTGGYTVEYTGFSHSLAVLKLAATLKLTPDSYVAHVTFHAAGLAGMFVRMDNDSQATGTLQAGQVHPGRFDGSGHLHGTVRLTRLAYPHGDPVIEALSPPVEQERTPVPVAETVHTIDTLSAVVLLIHQVGQDGKCDGTVTTFDGRRLATQTVHTAGRDMLARTDRSIFVGSALRCDFDGRQLGGYIRDENEENLKKPRHGTAWLADLLPGSPPVPVRVAFENKLLGQVTLYLTSATALK